MLLYFVMYFILILEVEPVELTPVYHATPISKEHDASDIEPVAKKKAKLEYIPMPALIKPTYKATYNKRLLLKEVQFQLMFQ